MSVFICHSYISQSLIANIHVTMLLWRIWFTEFLCRSSIRLFLLFFLWLSFKYLQYRNAVKSKNINKCLHFSLHFTVLSVFLRSLDLSLSYDRKMGRCSIPFTRHYYHHPERLSFPTFLNTVLVLLNFCPSLHSFPLNSETTS